MRQKPPPQLPWHIPELPARPPAVPAPDPVAVRLVTVPQSAPPFDDEEPPREMPDSPDPAPSASRPPGPADPTDSGGSGHPQDPEDPGRPGPATAWPSQFAQALAEALAGARPAQQLTPWTTEQARRRIRQLGPMLATDQRPRIRRVMTSVPAQDVLEMTAVVGFGPRVRVLALRLERDRAGAGRRGGGPWCCTAIESA
jgi:hypothetical protein